MDENHIRQWADTHECRRKLPILVRRLIRETAGDHLTSFRFPGNEAVDLHGLDGEVDVSAATTWVPEGHSIWEMGCNQDPRAKAQADYVKRVDEVVDEVRRVSSFAFVTPRRWPGKNDWLTEKRSQNQWANVLAYDAIDLEAWLEEAPVTRRWLGQLLGIAQNGLLTPEEWWNAWATAAEPPMTMTLVGTRRHDEAATLLTKLRDGERVIPVVGDDRGEATAFVVATLTMANADDLLDRMLVVTREDVVIPDPGNTHPIFLTTTPEGDDIDFGDRRQITIVRTYPKGRQDVSEPLQLSHVPSDIFRSELEQMGLAPDDASALASETGHSVTVLRRRLSADPEVRRPVWARDRAVAQALLPFAFSGSWLDRDDCDDAAVLGLLADVSDREIRQARDMLLRQDDAPIARYGLVNVVVSQLDTLFAIGAEIDAPHIDRFFELVPELFGDRDPALDLPPEQRWMANVLGRARSWSGALLSGLGDAVCILSVHGPEICGRRLGLDFDQLAARVVRSLLDAPDSDRWLTIRDRLRTLAEAAPSVFLDCIEADLRRPEPTIRSIMGVVDGGITGECLRADLLWALEMLAWHPRHFARVATIVFQLRRIEASDNWSNSPENTAAALFRAWLPSTAVDVDGRLRVLRALARTHRKATIDVCISLLPSGGPSFATRTARPKWRSLDNEVQEPTNEDVRRTALEASHLLLDMAPFDFHEMGTVLGSASRLHPDDLERLVLEAQRWSNEENDGQKANLRNLVRREVTSRVYTDAAEEEEALRIAFARLEQALEPTAATHRNRWLFDQQHVEWRALEQEELDGNLTWQERAARVRERRVQALEEIEQEEGQEAIVPFALGVGHPETVAEALVTRDTPPEIAANWIAMALDEEDPGGAFLRQMLLTLMRGDLEGTVRELLGREVLQDGAARMRVARSLPGFEEGWRVAALLGEQAEEVYWQNVYVRLLDDTSEESAQTAITRLLSADRPRSAFEAAYNWPQKISAALWERILAWIAQGGEPDGPMPNSWAIDRVLARLDGDPTISLDRIVQLELPFAAALSRRGRRPGNRTLATHQKLARDPAFFLELLTWIYVRHDGAAEEERDRQPEEQRRALLNIAYRMLDGWNEVPGSAEDETIDHDAFVEWNEQAKRLAVEADRLGPSESHLAGLYARLARRRPWDNWLPAPILDWLERAENGGLREHMQREVRNARGVTTRNPYDGGAQERRLAERYHNLSRELENTHPRVAEMLSLIAAQYSRDAVREDEQAALGERWDP